MNNILAPQQVSKFKSYGRKALEYTKNNADEILLALITIALFDLENDFDDLTDMSGVEA